MVVMKVYSSNQEAGPNRTCIGCRTVDLKSAMTRLVAGQNSEVVVDSRKCLSGRGAYVHPDSECIHKACRRGVFSHSLRRSDLNNIDPERLSGIINGPAQLRGRIHEKKNLLGIRSTDSGIIDTKPDHRRN